MKKTERIATVPALPPAPDTSEALLQSLIAECRGILRENITPMLAEADAENRDHLIQIAIELVQAGSQVGDSIARLRAGGQAPERRQRITVERIERPGRGEEG